ncbi:MAG: DUF255 domain-containing protein [Planctomycetaceae bacterium]
MRCSEAKFSRSAIVATLLWSLAVSPRRWSAAPPADSEHTAQKPQQHTNRLANETSPYLLLHAHNPVDWRPWGPEALQAAKDANKPIFLSIGYSSCYWCHVMEREVFENEAIAAYLNEHFICIKVDREERPDIDDQYMLALQIYFQAIGSPQGGGWPMSMFLTPDAKPFAGGTYFPAEDKPGQPGFRGVAEQVHTLWTTRETDLRNNADALASAVARNAQPGLALEKVELDRALVQGAIDAVVASYDEFHGGFGFNPDAPDAPKFPSPPTLMLLARHKFFDADKPDEAVGALDHTLSRIAMGGIRDHLGGGFHRYSVDRAWRVPHFEKMLYDQAQLVEVYSLAWSKQFEANYGPTLQTLYRRVVEETIAFVLREMTHPDGGFYSALDAETNGIEGLHYVWSREEIDALLGKEFAREFAAVYGLDHPSEFERGFVLFLPLPLEQTAKVLNLSPERLEESLAPMREKLLAARDQRPSLLRDEKILTGWNGLMIRALANAGMIFERPEYVKAAERAARFVLSRMRDDEGRLLHSFAGGKAGIAAYLDDYAYLISGLLALGSVSEDPETDWLRVACSLIDQQFVLFWDEQNSGFYYTADDHESLLTRMKDGSDSVLPNANAVSVENLLAVAVEGREYREPARQTLELFAPRLKETPTSMPAMAAALNLYLLSAGSSDPISAEPQPPSSSLVVAEKPTGELAVAPAEELVPAAQASADEAKKHDKVSATAYLSVDKIPAGGECNVAVVLNVKEGWHVNANPAQPKFLIPTELTAKLPDGFSLADVKYPAGKEFAQQGSDEALSVYEGRVVLYGKLKAPAAAAGKTAEAEITVRYQACNDQMCLRPMKLLLKGQFAVAKTGEKPQSINQSLFKPKRPQP